ncbi:MAG: DUF4340 domain-containing protein [Eubacteriales bacterium]|nr:DUF4340 domain-containing protein [Eubacteriales bacterium]
MKRSRRILILLVVLVIACAGTFGVMQYEEKKEQIKNSDEIILELDSDSVTSLAWEYESETGSETISLAFHKDGTWLYDDDEAFPVDEEKIAELLDQFTAFGVSFIIEEVEDYGQYGLDEPVCAIRLETQEESCEILLGNYSNMDEERYVSIGDGNVYLVKEDPLDTFGVTLSDLIKQDEIPLLSTSTATVTGIGFTGSENYDIVYEEENISAYGEDDVYFTKQDDESLPLDSSRVKSYISNISYLGLTDYVSYNVSEEELESFGLDEPELTVTVDYTWENEDGEEESNTLVLHISRDPEEIAAEAEKDAEDSGAEETADAGEETVTAYARVGDSQIVYRITSEDYENLMAASYDDLRYQKVFAADFAEAYQVDISLEGNVYSLTSTQEEEGDQTWFYQEEETDISDFGTALKGLTADTFTDEQPALQEEISLTVYLNNENYPKILIELYRYDGTSCLAMVDGEPVCLISRTQAVDLIEAVHAIVLRQ